MIPGITRVLAVISCASFSGSRTSICSFLFLKTLALYLSSTLPFESIKYQLLLICRIRILHAVSYTIGFKDRNDKNLTVSGVSRTVYVNDCFNYLLYFRIIHNRSEEHTSELQSR